MGEVSEHRDRLGTPGQETLTGAAARATSSPGKDTHTARALPRTTNEAGVLGQAPAPRAPPSDAPHLGQSAKQGAGVKAPAAAVQSYDDMLAAVLAARDLAAHAPPEDAAAHAQILALLAPVEKRLNELNDHQGRLAQFGAGNIAGQAALDMAETAIRSWRQRLMLGTIVRTEEHVLRFRSGAEVIRFLTRESADAPTLRGFDHASRVVGVGAAVPVLAPALVALAAEEAALLAFAGRVAAQRVVLWTLSNPAAALAASEALLGFGVQIGEDGWEAFWDQLQDPQGRWFVIAQVLMDFMHVKASTTSHVEPPDGARAPRPRGEPSGPQGHAPDVEAAREQVAKARAVVQRVHDAATEAHEPGGSPRAAEADSSQRKQAPSDGARASGDRTTVTDAAVDGARGPLGKAEAAGLLLKEIERHAGGLRRPALETIEPIEMARIKKEFADLGGDPAMLRFNQGDQTGYLDSDNIIQVRGDVNPVEDSLHPRSAMSSKATLGHELGHAAHRDTKLPIGAWNDEFRASYWAAKNLDGLSEQDRIHLILDAMERAKEAGVTISVNAFMRKVLYGY
jgi:hypothetical protein